MREEIAEIIHIDIKSAVFDYQREQIRIPLIVQVKSGKTEAMLSYTGLDERPSIYFPRITQKEMDAIVFQIKHHPEWNKERIYISNFIEKHSVEVSLPELTLTRCSNVKEGSVLIEFTGTGANIEEGVSSILFELVEGGKWRPTVLKNIRSYYLGYHQKLCDTLLEKAELTNM